MRAAIRTMVIGFLMAAASAASWAQPVRGTIEKADGHLLTLKTSEGAPVQLRLAENATVVAIVKASMADIKEGTYLGSAATPQPDGTQKAVEVHIFPEQMRGTGDGHRPFAPLPNGTMTNGAATQPTVTSVDGTTIVVKYRDGEKTIVVPPNVPIVRYDVGSLADLKPGARVTVSAPVRKPDGSMEASRINVGRDGAVPL